LNITRPDHGRLDDPAEPAAAAIIMAAGRGSRMKNYEGNKTLLPLRPGKSPYEGSPPMLLHILESLPPGPKAVVVHHREEDVIRATQSLRVTYCRQPTMNGTGGALLAARTFIDDISVDPVLVTMGDVPLVRRETYIRLVEKLQEHPMVVLGFEPKDRKQYGLLECDADRVLRIVEWKYWKDFPETRMARLGAANAGIYAFRREALRSHLPVLADRPHRIKKVVSGTTVELDEFFITDLVEQMTADGLSVGFVLADDEWEVMGVDDEAALVRAQAIFNARAAG